MASVSIEFPCYVGIDFGTSGARALALDRNQTICATAQRPFPEPRPTAETWQQMLWLLLADLPAAIRAHTAAIALNGTSSTVLLCDADGQPLDAPIYYNDKRAISQVKAIATVAPTGHVTRSATSSLAKLLWQQQTENFARARYFLHQADWLGFLLHGQLGRSDHHNALKLGCDPMSGTYPAWILELVANPKLLPQVDAPGCKIAPLRSEVAARFGFPTDCYVRAGTTDSIAAFLASDARQPGEAVTSLGSTLVLKLLSDRRIEAAEYGIYSHRLSNLWLAGGASNTGGAVLRHFFKAAELVSLSGQIDPSQESPFAYYPLLAPGDRFPINDPELAPCLTPRPDDPVEFLHGLLESMARIEALGYQRLRELGATPLTRVYTAGGGAKNLTWQHIRERHLGVPTGASVQTEAAYGTARLAMGEGTIGE
ncbi:MAG: FGGY-family carbohydrate kinase [Cyanobacteria bacterium J06641_5]